MVNGSWTEDHINRLWGQNVHKIYPPCDVQEFKQLKRDPEKEEDCDKIKTILSIGTRVIRTYTKFRLLTKIGLNVMHLVNLCKKIDQKLQIRGSSNLLNSVLYPASILGLQLHGILV